MPKRWVSNYLTWVQLKTQPLPNCQCITRAISLNLGSPVFFDASGKGEVSMDTKKRGHIPEDRMNQCIFRAKNCQMKDDGTWDCSTNLKECFGVHSRE